MAKIQSQFRSLQQAQYCPDIEGTYNALHLLRTPPYVGVLDVAL